MTKSSAKLKPTKKTAVTALTLALSLTKMAWATDDFAERPTIKRLPNPAILPLVPDVPLTTATDAFGTSTIARPKLGADLPTPVVSEEPDEVVSSLNSSSQVTAVNHQSAVLGESLPAAAVSVSRPQPPTSPQLPTVQALNQFYHEPKTCQGTWVYPIVGQLPDDGSIHALANRGYYDSKQTAELSGRVVVSQYPKQIRADKVLLDTVSGQALASGGVSFGGVDAASDLLGVAQELTYNTQSGEAKATEVAFASKRLHAHGYAKHLSHPSADHYELDEVSFSTCPPTHRLWQLDAKHLHLDQQSGRGVAKHATLKIKNTPVVHLPYFNFPLDDRRASGFLLPRVGLDSQNGLQLSTPYYFNLAPHYDATLTPTLYSDRNPRLVAEARYLNRHLGEVVFEAGYLPKDRQFRHKNRYHLLLSQTATPLDGENLTVFANYRRVSDGHYLGEFDRVGVGANPLNLPSEAGLAYRDERLTVNLKVQTFQRLDGVDSSGAVVLDKDRPYSRLPQLSATYRVSEGLPWGMQATAQTQSAYFKKTITDGSDSEKSGVRVYNRLTLSRPWIRPYGYLNSTFALTQLYAGFDEDSLSGQRLNKNEGRYHIIVPSTSIDGGLFLQKQGAPVDGFGTGGYQLLTPRLKYQYHTQKDQSTFPNFDTTLAAVSYHQLLADSWFLGYDRVSDLHALTPALNYRYIDSEGRTRLDAAIAEQFYLRDSQMGIDGIKDLKKGRSGPAWQLSVTPRASLWVDASGAFDPNHRLSATSVALRYQPKPNQLFGVGVIERRADPRFGQRALSAYTASAMFPIGDRWRLLTNGQYDRKNQRLMDMLVGATYQDCCLGLTIYGRQYRNELQPSDVNRAVMAEVSLTGLSGGGRLGRLLQERVVGFGSSFY